MASNSTVLTIVFLTAILSTLGGMAESPYGDDIYDPGSGPSQPDEGLLSSDDSGGLLSGLFGFLAGLVNGILSFLTGFLPELTGIWVIDALIINPLIAFLGYTGVKLVLGIIN